MKRRDYLLIGVTLDGFASLLDLESGAIDASLPLPAPAHLRCNTEDEEAAYKALVSMHSAFVDFLSKSHEACFVPVVTHAGGVGSGW